MRLLQFSAEGESVAARVLDAEWVEPIRCSGGLYALAQKAVNSRKTLADTIEQLGCCARVSYQDLIDRGRLLAPLTHPEPAHMMVSGTGLTHLGSASSRAAMHAKINGAAELTDSMKMFKHGLEGGKPREGVAFQPEWFYKGDGSIVVAPEQPFPVPAFALDAGEEPELVGLYLIGAEGRPHRIGFALGNELSDHVTEQFNYLWLAHSKLRPCSFGPEILVDEAPADIQGTSRIVRGNEVLWEKPFFTGESNMTYAVASLEHHHFKYAQFRNPGDVHVHFFGTATLSFADGVKTQAGDRFEIHHPAFGRPLRNTIARADSDGEMRVDRL